MSTLKVNELDTKTGTTITVAAGKTIAGTDIIGATQIAANAVTTAKILDDNVTTAKILDDNVTYGKLQDTTTNNRVLGAVTAGNIGEVQVGSAMLSDDAVGVDKMAPLARGKIIVGDASGDPSALTLGASTQVLTSDGSDAAWSAPAVGYSPDPIWYAYANSDKTGVSDATWTKCTNLGGETIDSDGAYDAANQKFTVPAGKAGKYYIFGSVIPGSGAVSTMYAVAAAIYIDGVKTVDFWMDIHNAGGFKMGAHVSAIIDLAVGAEIEIYGYGDMTSGTPAFYSSGFSQASRFFGWRVSS